MWFYLRLLRVFLFHNSDSSRIWMRWQWFFNRGWCIFASRYFNFCVRWRTDKRHIVKLFSPLPDGLPFGATGLTGAMAMSEFTQHIQAGTASQVMPARRLIKMDLPDRK
ncbi:hypothetical protein [Chromobacterium sphagni]|uniref:hypothetical protein n=1 Tax=Chromobacterium sphagni TaxID=1903179 RepID=UPI0011136C7E|nr:hypothetical protein [Chromobacterium sphagni]